MVYEIRANTYLASLNVLYSPSASFPSNHHSPSPEIDKMRYLALQSLFLFFLGFTLAAAVNGDSEVVQVSAGSALFGPRSDHTSIQVRHIKRQEDTGPGDESLASVPAATGTSQSNISSVATSLAVSSSTSPTALSTMSPSPTTDISQNPTSTVQSASGDTAIIATGTEPESVSTTPMPSSTPTDTSSTTGSTTGSASGDTAIVATGAAPTATGRWAAAGLMAVGIGGLMI